jgi:small subunit ribosomal protein S16
MAVKIRLMRMGRRNHPAYRIAVTDSRRRRDGRPIEVLGHYNPLTQPVEFAVDDERAQYWLKTGAIMSDTVKSLLKRAGILEKFTGVKYKTLAEGGVVVSKKARKREAVKAAEQAKAAEAPAEAPAAAETSAPAEQGA